MNLKPENVIEFFLGLKFIIKTCEKGSIINPINLIIRRAILLPFFCREGDNTSVSEVITSDRILIFRASSIVDEIFKLKNDDERK